MDRYPATVGHVKTLASEVIVRQGEQFRKYRARRPRGLPEHIRRRQHVFLIGRHPSSDDVGLGANLDDIHHLMVRPDTDDGDELPFVGTGMDEPKATSDEVAQLVYDRGDRISG